MIVLVTGLMRSGTTLVSRQLHRMGVPMGTVMRFPRNKQEDWEDVEFTDMMLYRLMGIDLDDDDGFKLRLQAYGIERDNGKPWGVKSPFALPYIDLFKEAVGGEVKVVLTTRDVEQAYRSLDTPALNELQGKLLGALPTVKPDLTIDIEESWASPTSVERKLRDLIRS